MFRLLAILSVVSSMMTLSVLANPTFPGTCLVSGMRVPHGATPATDIKYTVAIKQTLKAATGNTYSVTIGGQGSFTGLLLYATDTATKARFGSFINIPAAYSPLTICKGENPKTNTLGHNSVAPKKLPATFTWTDAGHGAGKAWKGSFTGIVMSEVISTWYIIPPTTVAGGAGGVANGTNITANPTGNAITPSGVSTAISSDLTSDPNPSATNATDASNSNSLIPSASDAASSQLASSAPRLDASFVLCVLLSAFALTTRL